MIFYFIVCFLFLSTTVFASYITLSVSIGGCFLKNRTCDISINIKNNGDEPAFNVYISSKQKDIFNLSDVSFSKIDPGERVADVIRLRQKIRLRNGTYPIVFKIIYYDANGYQFSTLAYGYVIKDILVKGNIWGHVDPIYLEPKTTKETVLYVLNEDQTKHNVTLRLFLPDEFSSSITSDTFEVDSMKTKKIFFRVTNLGALYGSTYTYLISLEYDYDRHYTTFVSGKIYVTKKTKPYMLYIFICMIFFEGFLLLYLKFIYRSKCKKRKSQ